VVVLAVLVVMGVVVVITVLLLLLLVVVVVVVVVVVNRTSRFPLSVENSGGAVHISAWTPDILLGIFIVLFKSL
jgi:Na+-transporting methylmalonyl-CoA/oxaloacetate decarboxylase gamma subunit